MSLLWGCLYDFPWCFHPFLFLICGIEQGGFCSFKLSISLLVQLFAGVVEYLGHAQLLNLWLAIRGLVRLINEFDVIEVTYVGQLLFVRADL